MLREPLERLKDADIAVLTKSDMGRNNIADIRRTLRQINDKIDIAESSYRAKSVKKLFSEEEKPLTHIAGKKVALLAGIADPDYFAWMVNNLGCEIIDRFYYTDHYPYKEKDIASVVKRCVEQGVDLIITTEKDAVRLRRLKSIPQQVEIFALKIDLRIDSNEETITGRLRSILGS